METSLLTAMNNQNIRIILLHDVRFAKVATKAKENRNLLFRKLKYL